MNKITKYNNPPLVEAVFELFFQTTNWNPVIPGLFYNEIKEIFPKITSNQTGFGFILDPQGIKIGGGNSDMTQYKNEEGNTIAQLTSGFLTINKLPKYNDWTSFKETIFFVIDALKRTLPPFETIRLGLKFINKIDIGSSHSYENFKKHFEVIPLIPKNFNNNLGSIQINLESPIIPDTEILALSLVSLKKEPNYNAPIMFQLYYTRIKDVTSVVIENWIQEAYLRLYETFDNSLTKSCKNGFNNIQ
jgi:uncharacterized protein (TIGR04255 family)